MAYEIQMTMTLRDPAKRSNSWPQYTLRAQNSWRYRLRSKRPPI